MNTKKIKDFKQFFVAVGLGKFTIYFKINLYIISKYPALGRSTLTSYYFKKTNLD